MTARGISTVRFTGHLRETSNAQSVGPRIGRARCRVSTPFPKGRSPNTRRYAKTAITSGRARAAAGRASLNHVVLLQTIALEGYLTNGGGPSGVRLSRHRGAERAERALFSYNWRWTKTPIPFRGGDHRRDGCHGPAVQRPRNGPIARPRRAWLGSDRTPCGTAQFTARYERR